MKKSKLKVYNDGYINIYKPSKIKNEFGAVKISKDINDMELVVKLAFTERYKRQSDIELANSLSRSLNIKVSTPLYKGVDVSMLGVVGNTIYSIYDMDIDRENNELYLYLEEYSNVKGN